MKLPILSRKIHYWAAIFVAMPLLIVMITGLLLQLKKHVAWIQPAEHRGTGSAPAISFAQVLEACRSIPHVDVQEWTDIHRLDVRPERGLLKVWAKSDWEIQIDTQTGRVLQTAIRRSDWIEALHTGSWFHEWVRLGIFVPAGVTLLLLWLTGLYLFWLPIAARRRRS